MKNNKNEFIKRFGLFIGVLVLLTPNITFAKFIDGKCSISGYTIATVNGVFTNEKKASDNMIALRGKFGLASNNQEIDYQYLLNPTHLGGIGDVATAIKQKAFEDEAVGGYDLTEMIRSASKKVKTQKLLLVAHSQGNFYANSFYDVVIKEGWDVNKESIGIYSVANPASRVAGGGEWITSDTDKVIAWVVGNVPFKKIKSPNTHIELQKGDDFAGHGFSEAYLKYKSTDIVKGIKSSLDKLASDPARSEDTPCIATPQLTLAHKTTGVVLAVADPLAEVGITTVVVAGKIAILPTVITVKGIYFATVAVSQAGTFIADTLLNTSVYVASKAIDTTAIVANEVRDAVTGLLSGGLESGASNMASIIGATTQATPQDEQVSATIISNDNFVDDTSVSVIASDESNDETLPTSLATQFETQEQSPASDTDTTTDTEMAQFALADTSPDTTQVKSYTSNGGGGGGGGGGAGSPQPATQDSNTESLVAPTEEVEQEVVAEVAPEPLLAPIISVPQCASSISLPEDNCLLATTTAHFVWSEIAGADYYAINNNGTFATTTATSTEVFASDYSDYTFDISAVGVAGNTSATSTKTVSFATTPVAINEVAWMGTVSSVSDEWIELKNNTAYTLDLSPWTLYANDGAPYISLTGTVAPHGTYVLERRDDTVTNITADQIYGNGGSTWALGNTGEQLILSYASTTIDETPAVSGNVWSAGYNSSTIRRTMERISSKTSGSEISNWGTNDGIIKNGMDVLGNAIDGTPGEENSVSVVPDTTPPVIKLSSSSPRKLLLGEVYLDSGATAIDDVDGVREVITTNNINAYAVGAYEVVYSASDLSGNTASLTRVVNVVVMSFPEILKPALFSDLNENSIADQYESDVVMTKNMTLLSGEYHFHNLTIENNAVLSLTGGIPSVYNYDFLGGEILAENLTVASGSRISADEMGDSVGGPNQGRPSESDYQHGANYGGIGLVDMGSAHRYGSALNPVALGSGSRAGGNGGGAVRISVIGAVTNNGVISANGGPSSSGGSVYVETNHLTGAGDFVANGGGGTNATEYITPGAGGRVMVRYISSFSTGKVESRGGCSPISGSDSLFCADNGTAAFKRNSTSEIRVSSWRFERPEEWINYNHFIIENGAVATMDEIFTSNFGELIVRGRLEIAKRSIINAQKIIIDGGTLVLSGEEKLNVGTLDIINNGTVTVARERTLTLNVNNLTIESGSSVSADMKGYGYLSGPGAPVDQYMGASYGGKGYGGAMSGLTYGSSTEPTDFGSGGGGLDTHGGGAIRIVSTGTIVIDGNISANGENTSSGGSVYITANNISGAGSIYANGGGMGGSEDYSWSGGGGRIAVYYKNSAFTGTAEALGGTSIYDGILKNGENGTVVMEQIVEEPVAPDPGAVIPLPVVPPLSSEKMITSFNIILEDSTNIGVVDNDTHTISITLPAGTPVTALAPVVEGSLLATVSPASGVTQDFTTPATYVVTAEDGTTQEYSVTANVLVETPVIPDPPVVAYPPCLPPFQEDVRTYSGLVTAVNDSSFTVHINQPNLCNQPNPSDDPALLDRTVEFTADTKITKRSPGDIATFLAEMEVYMEKMQSGNTEGAVPPNPPQPIIETVAVSTIVVGDTVTVTALENVRTMKSFSASEIEVQ